MRMYFRYFDCRVEEAALAKRKWKRTRKLKQQQQNVLCAAAALLPRWTQGQASGRAHSTDWWRAPRSLWPRLRCWSSRRPLMRAPAQKPQSPLPSLRSAACVARRTWTRRRPERVQQRQSRRAHECSPLAPEAGGAPATWSRLPPVLPPPPYARHSRRHSTPTCSSLAVLALQPAPGTCGARERSRVSARCLDGLSALRLMPRRSTRMRE